MANSLITPGRLNVPAGFSLGPGFSIATPDTVASATAKAPNQTAVQTGGLVTPQINSALGVKTTPQLPATGGPNVGMGQPSQDTLLGLQAQINQISQGIQGLSRPSYNFTTDTPSNKGLPSNYLSPGAIQDLMDQRNAKYQNMMSGSSNDIPSNGLSNYMQQVQDAYKYPQGYLDAYSTYNQAQAQSLQRSFDLRRQVQNLQENGAITKEQGTAYVNEANRRANVELADIENKKAAAAVEMAPFDLQRQANIQGVSALAPFYQPTQVAPGSTLVSPLSGGQPLFQGQGAAPAQIASYAQQLKQNDQITGQVQINPQTGQVDDNYYYQLAQQQLSGNGFSQTSGSQGSSTQTTTGGTTGSYGQGGYGNINQLPAALQQYVISPSLITPQGTQQLSFIQAERVPAGLQDTAKRMAQQAGIPYLDQAGTNAVYAAQQILQISDAAKALSIRNLGSGVTGRVSDTLKNWANNFLQFNPDLSNFNQLRDAASKATTALAGGIGSGFRMNMGIIDAAVQNLPRASDNLETALAKTDALSTQILNAIQPLFPNVTNPNLLQAKGTGQNVIQTSVGAVDNSWFQ